MRRLWFVLAAMFLLAGAMAVGYHRFKTTADGGLPRLEIIRHEIDLGTTHTREDREFQATVRNNSDEPLQIDRIRSSCGCTNARLGKNHVEPGEWTELRRKRTAGPFRH